MSEASFYVFEKKEKAYFKNGIEKSYERATRIDKKMEIKEVAKTLIKQGVVAIWSADRIW